MSSSSSNSSSSIMLTITIISIISICIICSSSSSSSSSSSISRIRQELNLVKLAINPLCGVPNCCLLNNHVLFCRPLVLVYRCYHEASGKCAYRHVRNTLARGASTVHQVVYASARRYDSSKTHGWC